MKDKLHPLISETKELQNVTCGRQKSLSKIVNEYFKNEESNHLDFLSK